MTAKITDPPPPEVEADLAELSAALDATLPAKVLDRNLLVATWNIRGFGGMTEKWKSESGDSPRRDLHAVRAIAEIVSRFDVIALQESKGDLKALRHMMKVLGPDWGLILTDVTAGDPGNGERMAYVFDHRKVQLSGLACELVVPKEQLEDISADALELQFARTPYAVSFRSGGHTFILVTLHVLYGDNAAARVPELKAIATWLRDWASDMNAWHHDFICLGDFNIDRKGDPLYDAFTSTGLTTPTDLDKVPRSIFASPTESDPGKFYDQIAWFKRPAGATKGPELSLQHLRSGNFDFVPVVLQNLGLSKTSLSWRISDHYPLWVEFGVGKTPIGGPPQK